VSALAEARDHAMESARTLKEGRVARATSRDQADMSPLVEGYRGSEPVVVLIPFKVDRDEMLRAAHLAAVGFGCDVIAVTSDSYAAVGKGEVKDDLRNPVTGRPFEPGDMQRLVEEHDALAKGWITEGLMTMAVNRAGDVLAGQQNYRLVERRSALGIVTFALEWDLPARQEADKGGALEGLIVDSLQASMNAPTIEQVFAQHRLLAADFGLTPEQARTHADCATVKALASAGFRGGVLLQARKDDAERSRIIEESLGALGGFRPAGRDF
jgi:hypothetical protein